MGKQILNGKVFLLRMILYRSKRNLSIIYLFNYNIVRTPQKYSIPNIINTLAEYYDHYYILMHPYYVYLNMSVW